MLSLRGARGVETAELNGHVDSDHNHGGSSKDICITSDSIYTRRPSATPSKRSGRVCLEGKVGVTRWERDIMNKVCPQPCTVAMEATIFTSCIYDHLKPHAATVKVAPPSCCVRSRQRK